MTGPQTIRIALTVNGRAVHADVSPRTHLADFLREELHLTGTHIGCEHGVCGACTLALNGAIVRGCIAYAVACDGADITTIEGLDGDPLMIRLRAAFSREHALQCGYCTPGMLITARDLLQRKAGLTDADIRREMSGNLCRCTGYMGIVRAIAGVMAEGVAMVGAGQESTPLGPAPGPTAHDAATHGSSVADPVTVPPERAANPRPALGAASAMQLDGQATRSQPAPDANSAGQARTDSRADGLLGFLASASFAAKIARPLSAMMRRRRAGHAALPHPAPDGAASLSRAPIAVTVSGLAEQDGFTVIRQHFTLPHPVAETWTLMSDLRAAVASMPGAELDEPADGGQITGRISVRLGPIRTTFAGEAAVTRDDAARRVTIDGEGRDKAHGSRARGSIGYGLSEAEGGAATAVDVMLSYRLSGMLAQFGRSDLVRDVIQRLGAAFAQNLDARLAGGTGDEAPEPPADVNALALLWAILKARLSGIWNRIALTSTRQR